MSRFTQEYLHGGGFLFRGAIEDGLLEQTSDPNLLEGKLVDGYGQSNITGEMIPGKHLRFEKHYYDKPDDDFFFI